MNERIRELELEAIAYVDSKVPVNDRYNDIYHNIVREKFAEFIVWECAVLAKKAENMWSDDFAWQAIVKHFRS
jgi:hypothetical protein